MRISSRLLLLQEWRLNRWSWSSLVILSFASLFLLSFYWFTQKALDIESLKFAHGLSYFQFVFLGEVFLVFPFSIVMGCPRVYRQLREQGVYDLIASSRPIFLRVLVLQAILWAAMESVRALVLILIVPFFGMTLLSVGQTIGLFGFTLLLLPASLGLGLFSCALVMKFGRGDQILPAVVLFAGLFSGVYFPTDRFPSVIQEVARAIFPFAIFLDVIRTLQSGVGVLQLKDIIYFTISSGIWLLLGWGLLRWSLSKT